MKQSLDDLLADEKKLEQIKARIIELDASIADREKNPKRNIIGLKKDDPELASERIERANLKNDRESMERTQPVRQRVIKQLKGEPVE